MPLSSERDRRKIRKTAIKIMPNLYRLSTELAAGQIWRSDQISHTRLDFSCTAGNVICNPMFFINWRQSSGRNQRHSMKRVKRNYLGYALVLPLIVATQYISARQRLSSRQGEKRPIVENPGR
jgi:hypothetical protein